MSVSKRAARELSNLREVSKDVEGMRSVIKREAGVDSIADGKATHPSITEDVTGSIKNLRHTIAKFPHYLKALVPYRRDEIAALPKIIGPCLRFSSYDSETHLYECTVLVVTGVGVVPDEEAPKLLFSDPAVNGEPHVVDGEELDMFSGFTFWRFVIKVTALKAQRSIDYTVSCIPSKQFRFYVAGYEQKWKWGFYSCNGFHDPKSEAKYGSIAKLWKDALQHHSSKEPMHVMVGGGDQLYNDDIWTDVHCLEKWLLVHPIPARLALPFGSEMEEQVSFKYFKNYMLHWSKPMFSEAMTTIPQVMMWDDHDIFDGWGSYKPEVQECPVFQGVFKFACRFYCLFQQHSTPEKIAEQNKVFGDKGWSWISQLGVDTALLSLDTRMERTRDVIMNEESYDIIKEKLMDLPSSVRHVMVIATVPLIYPKVASLDGFVNFMSSQGCCQGTLEWFMRKIGQGSFFGMFDEPELLDDLIDHWSSTEHAAEKCMFIKMLQEIAKDKGVRVTFISGDVHAAAAGVFKSRDETPAEQDHRYMLQITSSAIGNEPPPEAAVKTLNFHAVGSNIDDYTREEPLKLFNKETLMIKGKRNWCLVTATEPTERSGWKFEWRVEAHKGMVNSDIKTYSITAPMLDNGVDHVLRSPEDIDIFAKEVVQSGERTSVQQQESVLPMANVLKSHGSEVLNQVLRDSNKEPLSEQPRNALGPCLRFAGYDPKTYTYSLSALVVTVGEAKPPVLTLWKTPESHGEEVQSLQLDTFKDYKFWRFDLSVKAGMEQQMMSYSVSPECGEDKFYFYVPGFEDKWNWGFYSCNGFHDPEAKVRYGGIQPLWKDVLNNHVDGQKKLHVMVGGGDQLYNDTVFELPLLKEWLAISNISERINMPFTPGMEEEVEWFYFQNYVNHWHEDLFSDALATIPQVMMWDDHDIFDGWGSYKPEVQECPVFQGMFRHARRFYCLFQQHSTPDKMYELNGVFGDKSWSQLVCFGKNTAALVLDTRNERSRKQVMTPKSWEMVREQLKTLPSTVRHVVVVATVPVMYPRVKILESFIHYMTGSGFGQDVMNKFLNVSGIGHSFFGTFDEAELMDDLTDHWSFHTHKDEKESMLALLQDIAKSQSIRFTFLSGDVHAAAAGCFKTKHDNSPNMDHRYMLQVISSAIGNEPPPAMVVKVLNSSAATHGAGQDTIEEPFKLFNNGCNMILGARNWCMVTESDDTAYASLNFQLRCEGTGTGPTSAVNIYNISTPSLDI